MKKTAAILGSVLFYMGAFLLIFRFCMGEHIRWWLLGFPMVVAVYFIIVGNLFAKHLQLNRWSLWLSINLIGGLCSWIILIAWFPILLTNGMILFLIAPLIGVFAVVWAVVGVGFLCAKGLKGQTAIPDKRERTQATRPQQASAWGAKGKKIVSNVGILLLIVAAVSLYTGIRNFTSVRPVTDYEDSGVHTFTPYDILPVQVKNNGTRRSQRRNPTRTVYMVYYHTTDGTGYRWQAEGGSARTLAEQLYDRGPVERRVLSIPADNTYITVEADQTAESYTESLRQKYILMMSLSGGYVLIYVVAWIVIWSRRQRREQSLL